MLDKQSTKTIVNIFFIEIEFLYDKGKKKK